MKPACGKRVISERLVRDAARAGRHIEVTVDAPVARISLGSDHGGFKLKESLKPVLAELGFTTADVGCGSTDAVDYPVFAARVACHDITTAENAREHNNANLLTWVVD